jgi:hypothetical protein
VLNAYECVHSSSYIWARLYLLADLTDATFLPNQPDSWHDPERLNRNGFRETEPAGCGQLNCAYNK